MSFSINHRHRRPIIEPIQTGHTNLLYRSRRFSRRRHSPLSEIIPSDVGSLGSVASGFGRTKREMRFAARQALRKLQIPETSSNVIRFTNPGLGHTHFGPYMRRSSIVVESPSPTRGHHMPGGRGGASLPCSPNTLRMSFFVTLPSNYTPTSLRCESDIGRMQLADIQRARLGLWEQGHKRFGHLEDADVFVRPLPLKRCNEDVGSHSEDLDTPFTASPSFPFQSPDLPSPTSATSRCLSVRAIIHSKFHSPIGLKREFDMDALRATIPDPLPSPRSPNFNPKALLSNLAPLSRNRRASYPPDSISINASYEEDGNKGGEERSDCDVGKTTETVTSPRPSKHERFLAEFIAVPINVQYARAQLPALAAIIMSDRVWRGDTIELALPQPQVWPETIAYVYTGEAQLLTEQTKENILYLGGKI